MYDVIIIGAGIVGCAVARALGRYRLRVLVLEREADIACGASKANSGILHAGYDCEPGTQKAALNVRGIALYKTLAEELDIPCRTNGSLVICSEEDDLPHLRRLYERGQENGVPGLSLLTGAETLALEPHVNPHIKAALHAETAGVISPYEAAVAFAENAAANGVVFMLETTVNGIRAMGQGQDTDTDTDTDTNTNTDADTQPVHGNTQDTCADTQPVRADINDQPRYHVETNRGMFSTRAIVNAAGAESALMHNYVCENQEALYFQRGQYYLLDNTQRDLVTRTIFQLPTKWGKGVLVVPTEDYNVLLGPNAETVDDPYDTQTTAEGLEEVIQKVALTLTNVPARDKITAFAGIRAKHESGDFVIGEPLPGFFDAVGIDSPGLSAAPAIAERIEALVTARLQPSINTDFISRREGIKRFRTLSFAEQAALIRENPAYGQVVCRCETITEAEIVEAIRRPVGARNLDAVKRRTRAQMGRCQGGFCTVRIVELLSRELGIAETAVVKNNPGSYVVCQEVRR